MGSFLRVTYGVGVGGVEVGAHDALLLDFGEDISGDWVGECHVNGLGGCVVLLVWRVLVWVGCLGGSGKVAKVGGKLL